MINFDSENELEALNENLGIISYTNKKIELIHEQPDGLESDYLTFEI